MIRFLIFIPLLMGLPVRSEISAGTAAANLSPSAPRSHAPDARVRFEDLGRALEVAPVSVSVSTEDTEGRRLAFGVVHDKGNNHFDAFVVDLENATTQWLGLQEKFGLSYIRMARAANGHVYMFSGEPGNFTKYDVNSRKLVDLGHPGGAAIDVSYHFGHGTGPDGKIYVAGYPSAHVFVCDPATDSIADLGTMTEDAKRQKYGYPPQVDGRNEWLYVPLGLHHLELCAYSLKTGEKHQILPPELTALPGSPSVTRGVDGNVYGSAPHNGGYRIFLCRPDGIEDVIAIPTGAPVGVPQMLEGLKCSDILGDGKLTVTEANGKMKVIQTPLEGITFGLYSVGCERNGIVYGGGANNRPNVFSYDTTGGVLRDLGRLVSGGVQIYDLLSHSNGLYLSSYPGANIDLYNPETGQRKHIAQLSENDGQERLQRLSLGPDGMIYAGGTPIKGHLGGAIVRVNPVNNAVSTWRNVVANQSVNMGVAVPATKEMFFTTSIRGGSSAIPVEKQAFVILWDCGAEKETWRGEMIPGTTDYGSAMLANNGKIYGLAGTKYYVFDPVNRKLTHRGDLPVTSVRSPGLARRPAGPDELIYGVGDDAIFAINPKDDTVRTVARHPSLTRARGFFARDDGTLFYGSGSHLWRALVDQ